MVALAAMDESDGFVGAGKEIRFGVGRCFESLTRQDPD